MPRIPIDGVEFHRPVTMHDGWKTRKPDRGLSKVLEVESPGETDQRSLEDTRDLDGGVLLDKTRARDDSRAGCVTGHPPGVFHGEADDFGNEHSDAGTVSASKRCCGTVTKCVHAMLGSPVHWVLCSCILPLERNRNKLLDDRGQENEVLDDADTKT